MGPQSTAAVGKALPAMNPEWGRQRLLGIDSLQAARGGAGKLPSSVQQNVPAWALFNMFFIVVPMGGSLIREKQEGTLLRVMSLPVSYLTFFRKRHCCCFSSPAPSC